MNTPSLAAIACHGECPSGSKEETQIFCGDAKNAHGICVRHSQMNRNGELRFRLNSTKDGSAYIRTQTTGESQGWQEPHFHNHLKETYIVERGWIGYVELVDDAPLYQKCGPGDVFTTTPGVVHNIFMPPDSIIHTVKHGGGPHNPSGESDRWSDARCTRLLRLVGSTFPDNLLLKELPIQQLAVSPENIYNAAYRHFDSLIWQIPAGASALFAAIVASVNSLLSRSLAPIENVTSSPQYSNPVAALFHISAEAFAAIPVALFGVLTLVLGYALHRFRWHQIGTRTWFKTQESPKVSPQTLLQLLVNIEAALLLFVAGSLFGLPRSGVGVAVLLIVGYLYFHWEWIIGERSKAKVPQKVMGPASEKDTPISGAS